MDFLRRLLGGSQPAPRARPEARGRQGLTPAYAIAPVPLDPTWPVIPAQQPAQQNVRGLTTDERNALPFEATACPSCGAEVAKPPKGRKKCTACGAYMLVRVIDLERRRLVTEADAVVIDRADAERQAADRHNAEREWYRSLIGAGILLCDQPEEGGVDLDVVGESHYHADLAGLMAALRPDPDASEVWTAARLVREPQNQYDRNAVRVEIHGRLVGHLSREDAEDIQRWIKKVERRQQPAYVLARLGGGRVTDGVVGPIGVSLVNLPEDALD
ncbi:MAG: HIRAN domain-containing protein [Chloroflexota bacterium]